MTEKMKWTLCKTVLTISISLGLSPAFPSLLLAGSSGNIILHPQAYTGQLIVKYRDSGMVKAAAAGDTRAKATALAQLNTLTTTAGAKISHVRFMSGNGHVVKLPRLMTIAEANTIAKKLKSDPNVEYAEPDILNFPKLTPNDPEFANQWHYAPPATAGGGANLPAAWDITTGSNSIVVAVIDTGILPNHPDILGRTVQGYNFISNAVMAGNGVGRSSDPTDLGDWVTSAESADSSSILYGCTVENSSWHGTHVAGTIGASSNNNEGVSGINWVSKILPVRVLGKCGGYTSDIADGMRWAAGLPVTGVTANANPAKVLNMSLGGSGSCGPTFQNAINDVIAAGATIVVAAGNENTNMSNSSPANCTGVISVAAVNRTGGRTYYSNYGTGIKIAAPGGEIISGATTNGVLSTLNSGATTASSYTYQYYQGTSMAAPHVSGIASLVLSLNPNLTSSQVLSILQSTARSFPTSTGSSGGDCTTLLCGAGIIDAAAAVRAINITTADITGITTTTATGGGSNISSLYSITAKGVCWSTSVNPTTADSCTNDGTGAASFTSSITGLTANTTYHVRAYAIHSAGTSYGSDFSFTTAASALLPTLTTTPAGTISTTSASSGGNVTSDGGSSVTAKGICWATTANPTIANNYTADGAGTGAFTSSITGLAANTTYHVRAYATNAAGTAYGLDQNFTTSPANPPSVTTASVSGITTTSATGGGNVTFGGGSTVSAKGVCWSTSSNPSTSDNCSSNGTGTGTFVSSITGLSAGTAYHVRAYAVNTNGTSYGSDTTFTTLAATTTPTVITTMPIKSITTTSATAGGNVISDGGSSVTERGVCWSTSVNPVIGGNCTYDNSGAGKFISSITGLATNTRYYVRAFAVNAKGSSYGNNVTFKTGKRPVKFILYPPQ